MFVSQYKPIKGAQNSRLFKGPRVQVWFSRNSLPWSQGLKARLDTSILYREIILTFNVLKSSSVYVNIHEFSSMRTINISICVNA